MFGSNDFVSWLARRGATPARLSQIARCTDTELRERELRRMAAALGYEHEATAEGKPDGETDAPETAPAETAAETPVPVADDGDLKRQLYVEGARLHSALYNLGTSGDAETVSRRRTLILQLQDTMSRFAQACQ